MKKVFITTSILLGLGGLAYGVYNYYIKQYEILENWDYRIVGVRLVSAGVSKVVLELQIEVVNDSSISIVVTDYYFDIFLNGVKVGVIKNASLNQRLEKNGGKSYFPMLVEINTFEFLKGDVLLGLIDSVKNSTITQKGYFGLKKGIIKFRNIPFEYTYKLKDFM